MGVGVIQQCWDFYYIVGKEEVESTINWPFRQGLTSAVFCLFLEISAIARKEW